MGKNKPLRIKFIPVAQAMSFLNFVSQRITRWVFEVEEEGVQV